MLETILSEGFAAMGIACDETALKRFRVYYDLLSQVNQVMNLTAISGEEESARLHFLDCAAPLLRFDMAGASVVDVGAGAGFPGLPLKILCPSLRLTLLDSQRKRVDFLRQAAEALALEDVECVQARAEEPGPRRETYDFAVSRAVARMNVLCELCMPYVRPGGTFLALKGPAVTEELREAARAIPLLGGQAPDCVPYHVPGTELRHTLAVIQKQRPTPKKYPRPFAQIKKAPL